MHWPRVGYRAAQFTRTLTARLSPVDTAYVAARLAAVPPGRAGAPPSIAQPADRASESVPPLFALFLSMGRAEQLHGIETAHALERAGFSEPTLLGAALLHDVGKTVAPPGLFARVVAVLGHHFMLEAAQRWGEWREGAPVSRGWRRGFVVRRHHAAWGAALVAAAGAPEQMVRWIRRHHDPPGADAHLAALQRADEGMI